MEKEKRKLKNISALGSVIDYHTGASGTRSFSNHVEEVLLVAKIAMENGLWHDFKTKMLKKNGKHKSS